MGRLDRVIDNYEVKLRLEAEGRLSEREITDRVQRFSCYAAREDMVLNQTRQVLCSHGVAVIMFAAYHAFTRELGKLTREVISTETLQCRMMETVEKWVMRGLRREALLDIAINVYNVCPPAAQSDTK